MAGRAHQAAVVVKVVWHRLSFVEIVSITTVICVVATFAVSLGYWASNGLATPDGVASMFAGTVVVALVAGGFWGFALGVVIATTRQVVRLFR